MKACENCKQPLDGWRLDGAYTCKGCGHTYDPLHVTAPEQPIVKTTFNDFLKTCVEDSINARPSSFLQNIEGKKGE